MHAAQPVPCSRQAVPGIRVVRALYTFIAEPSGASCGNVRHCPPAESPFISSRWLSQCMWILFGVCASVRCSRAPRTLSRPPGPRAYRDATGQVQEERPGSQPTLLQRFCIRGDSIWLPRRAPEAPRFCVWACLCMEPPSASCGSQHVCFRQGGDVYNALRGLRYFSETGGAYRPSFV